MSSIQSGERAIFLLLDVPARWLMDIADTIIGNRGHIVIGSGVAVYFAVFGLIDAKATMEETRGSLERSLFITLVSSGNAASFVAAMSEFGSTQTMLATEHPSWFQPWHWLRTYQPNRVPLWHWAVWRLALCNQDAKDCSLDSRIRIDLRRANLKGADLSAIDLRGADLSGADLGDADLILANLDGARYDLYTTFPAPRFHKSEVSFDPKSEVSFDPDKAGMVRIGPPANATGRAQGGIFIINPETAPAKNGIVFSPGPKP